MKTVAVLLLAFLSPVVFAQSCPISFRYVDTGINIEQGTVFGTKLTVGVQNDTPKYIRAVKLKVVLYDATGDPSDYVYELIGNEWIKPGKSTTFRYALETVDKGSLANKTPARVYPVKIMFEDGTTWADDGSKACMSPE